MPTRDIAGVRRSNGRLLGTAELTTLGLCAGVLIGGAVVWTRTRTLPVRLVRTLRPPRVPVGDGAPIDHRKPMPRQTLVESHPRLVLACAVDDAIGDRQHLRIDTRGISIGHLLPRPFRSCREAIET